MTNYRWAIRRTERIDISVRNEYFLAERKLARKSATRIISFAIVD